MHILFHPLNITAEENGYITLTDHSEVMSNPHQISEEVNGDKYLNI